MTVEEIRNYAREKGISEKRLQMLVNDLHPNEKGELEIMEAMEAFEAIDFAAYTKEYVEYIQEAIRASREQHKARYGSEPQK